MRDDVKPERVPSQLDQPGSRGCDLIFRTTESGRERLPDRRAVGAYARENPATDAALNAGWDHLLMAYPEAIQVLSSPLLSLDEIGELADLTITFRVNPERHDTRRWLPAR